MPTIPHHETVAEARDRCRRPRIMFPELQSPSTLRELAARNDAGESVAKLAAEIGCTPTPLWNALKDWRRRHATKPRIETTARERARQRRAA